MTILGRATSCTIRSSATVDNTSPYHSTRPKSLGGEDLFDMYNNAQSHGGSGLYSEDMLYEIIVPALMDSGAGVAGINTKKHCPHLLHKLRDARKKKRCTCKTSHNGCVS